MLKVVNIKIGLIRIIAKGNIDCSLILVRTKRGEEILQKAINEDYLEATESNAKNVVKAQRLVERRKVITARIAGLRFMGKAAPIYKGFYLWRASCMVSILVWIKYFLGMIKRIVLKIRLDII